jgi:CheY-like chemotaxis protein
MRILVVEDNDLVADAIVRGMAMAGFAVDRAATAEAAAAAETAAANRATAGNQAETAGEAREQRDRVGEQDDAGRRDDVKQVMVRGCEHVDRGGGRVEPGCRP